MRILNKTVMIVALLLQASAALPAQSSGPSPYPDAKAAAEWPGKGPIRYFYWMTINRKSFWAAREADQGKIIFAGDSVIGGWKLQKDFAGKPVANRGIGGDVTRGLLFRFQEDILDLHPKAIVLHIGSNDLSQYALARDRTNPAVAADLDGLHPAILRLIDATVRGGAAHGRWTGVTWIRTSSNR